MPKSDPISAVSVVSTGTVAIRPQHIATDGSPALWWALTERQWTQPLPISVYVIEHQDGLVLFDTGQHPDSLTDPDYFPRGPLRVLYRRLGRAEIGADETLTQQLARIGYDISDVRTAVISHLHHDHAGGLAELRHAEIVVAADEWKSMHDPLPGTRGFFPRHIDLPGLRWRKVTPEAAQDPGLSPFEAVHDLLGDGSLIILPTPGHNSRLGVTARARPRGATAADGGRHGLRPGLHGARAGARAGQAVAPDGQHPEGQRPGQPLPWPGGASRA